MPPAPITATFMALPLAPGPLRTEITLSGRRWARLASPGTQSRYKVVEDDVELELELEPIDCVGNNFLLQGVISPDVPCGAWLGPSLILESMQWGLRGPGVGRSKTLTPRVDRQLEVDSEWNKTRIIAFSAKELRWSTPDYANPLLPLNRPRRL